MIHAYPLLNILTRFISLYPQLRSSITSVEEYTIGVGVMGVGGNKGSVAARFHLFGHKIMVLNCHLTAHQQNVEGRNRDLHKV
eukprot:1071621-Amorphochlora_amoeboformis.AAC.1